MPNRVTEKSTYWYVAGKKNWQNLQNIVLVPVVDRARIWFHYLVNQESADQLKIQVQKNFAELI